MLRRDFLRGVALTALGAGLFDRLPLGAAEPGKEKEDGKFDLVAVKGKSPGDMFDLAIAAVGGMKPHCVR